MHCVYRTVKTNFQGLYGSQGGAIWDWQHMVSNISFKGKSASVLKLGKQATCTCGSGMTIALPISCMLWKIISTQHSWLLDLDMGGGIPWPGPVWLLFLGSPQESNLWDLSVSRRWYGSYNFCCMWKYSTCQRSLTECIATRFIASMPVTELVATSLNALR
jgi:hypothetical protein